MNPTQPLREYLHRLILLSPSLAKGVIDEAHQLLHAADKPRAALPPGESRVEALVSAPPRQIEDRAAAPTAVNRWPMPWELENAEDAQLVAPVTAEADPIDVPLGANTLRTAKSWARPKWAWAAACFSASCVLGFVGAWVALSTTRPIVPAATATRFAPLKMPAEEGVDLLEPLPAKPRPASPASPANAPKKAKRPALNRPQADPFATRN